MGDFVKRQLANLIDLARETGFSVSPEARARGSVAARAALAQTLHYDFNMEQLYAAMTAEHAEVVERWRLLGTPTFALTEDLTAALIQTDADTARVDDLPLPLDVFCVELPTRDPLVRLNFDDVVEPIESIYVARAAELPPDWAADTPENLKRMDADARPGVQILICSQSATMQLFMGEDETVGSAIRRALAEATGRNVTVDTLRTAGSAAMLAVNLCFYLADLPRRAWGGEKRRLPARGPRDVVSVPVGREIKLPQNLVQAARELASAGETGARWRIRARFVVRGHWRNQAVGKGRAERKRIWILPFWKNKTGLGEAIRRRYRVDAPEQRK